MQIVYVGPFDAVETQTGVDDLGQPEWTHVVKGEPLDVADEIAGHPPAAAYLEAHDDIARLTPTTMQPGLPDEERATAQEQLAAAHAARVAGDPGAGLLAQPENWQPASVPPKAKQSSRDTDKTDETEDGDAR